MLRAKHLLATLHLLLACLACVALLGAPLASFTTARGVIIEENEEKPERTEGAQTSSETAPVARRRFERPPHAERTVDELRHASRHVPGVSASRPPRPNPGWLRPIRC